MTDKVTYEEAMEWLERTKEDQIIWDETVGPIIEYIEEMLWQYNDMRNS